MITMSAGAPPYLRGDSDAGNRTFDTTGPFVELGALRATDGGGVVVGDPRSSHRAPSAGPGRVSARAAASSRYAEFGLRETAIPECLGPASGPVGGRPRAATTSCRDPAHGIHGRSDRSTRSATGPRLSPADDHETVRPHCARGMVSARSADRRLHRSGHGGDTRVAPPADYPDLVGGASAISREVIRCRRAFLDGSSSTVDLGTSRIYRDRLNVVITCQPESERPTTGFFSGDARCPARPPVFS